MQDTLGIQFPIIPLLAGIMLLLCPRRWILPIFLAVTALVSLQCRMYIGGLNFFVARILLLFAWARVLARGEHRGLTFQSMDKAFILYCCSLVVMESLRRGLPGAIYAVANNIYDALGTYFLARIFLRDPGDITRTIRTLGVICSFLALFMLAEYLTRRNWLTPLGAVIGQVQSRAGRLRCQATFLHPVLAGTYGAVLFPLFAACWWQGRRMKILAVAGCLASTIMTLTAGSGGPFMTYAAVIGAMFLWPLRRHMRPIRWATLLTLLALQLMMKAPVWALIARIPLVQGASGYHRFNLLDGFIRNTGNWWLVGTESTEAWGFLTDDVANHYCVIAKHGGMLALLLFIALLVKGFREVGWRRREAAVDRATEVMVWAFGASLFGHLVTFFGTSYFDQTVVLWHVTLAMTASLGFLTQSQEGPALPLAPDVGDGILWEGPAPMR